jgi:hypothetical protein
MGSKIAGRPPLAWSLARQAVFDRCKRRYLLRYYVGWGGWSADAPPLTRLAYTLSKLTTLQLALGAAVHEAARDIATAVLNRRRKPSVDEIRDRVRAALNAVVRSSRDVEAFLLQPRINPMLQEVYYGGGLSAEAIARTAERLDLCTATLVRVPLWAEIASLPPSSIILIDSLEIHRLDGTPVYAAPDLAYLSGPQTATIVDFKTGNAREEDIHLQLALYALAVREKLGDAAPSLWRGRAILLEQDTELIFDLTDADLECARVQVQDGYSAMLSMLIEEEANVPRPTAAFPVASRRAGCPACPFWQICEDEVRGVHLPPRGVAVEVVGDPPRAACEPRRSE